MKKKILPCIIGLGYVGLPVFLQLQKKFKTTGYDVNKRRVELLKKGIDGNLEYQKKDLKITNNSILTNDYKEIKKCNFFIVCVPTPIFSNKKPNLNPLFETTKLLSKVLKKDDIIFIESTIFPGTTDKLKKIIEQRTSFQEGKKFFIGYSPERINPGDKKNSIEKIKKIVAFNNSKKKNISIVQQVYRNLCSKIVFTKNIREAETAKVIENIQRDLNIAFINEVLIFSKKFNLDFDKILNLANTKWNFINFKPGLVGGHCLPVDPYYLYYIASKKGINLKTVLAGRLVNDKMVNFTIEQIKKNINQKKIKKPKILLMGMSYKPDVADFRNSLSIKIYSQLKKKFNNTYAYDPYYKMAKNNKIKINNNLKIKSFDLVVILTKHKVFKNDIKILKRKKMDILELYK